LSKAGWAERGTTTFRRPVVFHTLQAREGGRTQPILRHEADVGLLLDALDLSAGVEDVHGGLAVAPADVAFGIGVHLRLQRRPGRTGLRKGAALGHRGQLSRR
jgi:hypothetical protein